MTQQISRLKNIIYMFIILFSMLFMRNFEIMGSSFYLIPPFFVFIFMALIETSHLKIDARWIKRRTKLDWPILVVLSFVFFQLIASLFSTYIGATINRNFIFLMLLSGIIYAVFYHKSEFCENWLEIIMVSGGIGVSAIILSIIQVPYINYFIGIEEWNSGGLSSYILLPLFAAVTIYTSTEVKKKKIFSFIIVVLCFFALFLNKNQVSLWITFLFLLGIPCIFRPRAELVKRAMQLLFAYVFLWCNMSLLVNYVKVIPWPELNYNLEMSVYGELILSIAAVIFFHFWDHIPEGMGLKDISLVGLQRIFRTTFFTMILLFAGCLSAGELLHTLPNKGIVNFLRSLTTQLAGDLRNTTTSFYVVIRQLGIPLTILVLIFFVYIGKKIYKKVDQDKQFTNYLFLYYIIFTMQFLFFDIADNVVIVNMMLLVWGVFIEERTDLIKAEKVEIKKERIKEENTKEILLAEEKTESSEDKEETVIEDSKEEVLTVEKEKRKKIRFWKKPLLNKLQKEHTEEEKDQVEDKEEEKSQEEVQIEKKEESIPEEDEFLEEAFLDKFFQEENTIEIKEEHPKKQYFWTKNQKGKENKLKPEKKKTKKDELIELPEEELWKEEIKENSHVNDFMKMMRK